MKLRSTYLQKIDRYRMLSLFKRKNAICYLMLTGLLFFCSISLMGNSEVLSISKNIPINVEKEEVKILDICETLGATMATTTTTTTTTFEIVTEPIAENGEEEYEFDEEGCESIVDIIDVSSFELVSFDCDTETTFTTQFCLTSSENPTVFIRLFYDLSSDTRTRNILLFPEEGVPDGNGGFQVCFPVTVPTGDTFTPVSLSLFDLNTEIPCELELNIDPLIVEVSDCSCIPPAEPIVENCWDQWVFDEEECVWLNIGEQPTEPIAENCYDAFEFDEETCSWINAGSDPLPIDTYSFDLEPSSCITDEQFRTTICVTINEEIQGTTKFFLLPNNHPVLSVGIIRVEDAIPNGDGGFIYCEDFAVDFRDGPPYLITPVRLEDVETGCTFEFTGEPLVIEDIPCCSQPAEPVAENCYDVYEFDEEACAWINTGVQPTEPIAENCYDVFEFDPEECVWVNTGSQPVEPILENCYDVFEFDPEECVWVNTGSQPEEPSAENCYDAYVFDTEECIWLNTGNQPEEPISENCYDAYEFDTEECIWVNTGIQPEEPISENCYDAYVFDTEECIWVNTGNQSEEPSAENCYDAYEFDTEECVWVNTGIQPAEPVSENCYDAYVFDTEECIWINTGNQPEEPSAENCYDAYEFDPEECVWVNTGIQPAEPVSENCYDAYVFDTEECIWVNTGNQPEEPAAENCYDAYVFDTEECIWVNTGNQPEEPSAENCYDAYEFDTEECVWVNTGIQPAEPVSENCYDAYEFDTEECAWVNTGNQPEEPSAENCYDAYEFDTEECVWVNTGIQPAEPVSENCYDAYVFDTEECIWINTGNQPEEPSAENCYDAYEFDTEECVWVNTGIQPAEPVSENCYDAYVFDTEECIWVNTGNQPEEPSAENCYDAYEFDPEECVWVNTGIQPAEPVSENCYDAYVFDAEECIWINTGNQPEEPSAENCYDAYEFDAEECVWVNTGIQPEEPISENCYDVYVFDTEECIWVNTGRQPAEPTAENCGDVYEFNTDQCIWVNVGSGSPVINCSGDWFESLTRGTVVTNQIAGVTINGVSTRTGSNRAMIFDSANPTGNDPDLATGNYGKILIISEDGNSSDPDDDTRGGTLIFNFDSPQYVDYVNLVDTEEAGGMVRLLDSNGAIIADIAIPAVNNGVFQQLPIEIFGVTTMEIHLAGSGAVTDYCIDGTVPTCFNDNNPSPPPACTGRINGFLLNAQNGSPLLSLTDGIVLCAADYASRDIKIRAAVSGAHESLKFTITTPEGVRFKTENVETYDSHQFWATTPGTYTINAKLYSEANLTGNLCDEITLTFTIEDAAVCAPPTCTGTIDGFSLNPQNGSPLFSLTDGMVLCAADYEAHDVRIRAIVSGEHESLRFAISTPEGVRYKTENVETYDSHQFWATTPGTYTITAKLYSEPNLEGTLCDQFTLTFTIDDKSPACADLDPCEALEYSFRNNKCTFSNVNNAEHILVVYNNKGAYRGHCFGNCNGDISISYKSSDKGLYAYIFDKTWNVVCRRYIAIPGRIGGEEGSVSASKMLINNTSELALLEKDQELLNATSITLSPNPASTHVSVDLQSLAGEGVALTLYNNLGQVVYQQRLDKATHEPLRIATSQFKNGLYLLEIQGKDSLPVTKKLIIKQ